MSLITDPYAKKLRLNPQCYTVYTPNGSGDDANHETKKRYYRNAREPKPQYTERLHYIVNDCTVNNIPCKQYVYYFPNQQYCEAITHAKFKSIYDEYKQSHQYTQHIDKLTLTTGTTQSHTDSDTNTNTIQSSHPKKRTKLNNPDSITDNNRNVNIIININICV